MPMRGMNAHLKRLKKLNSPSGRRLIGKALFVAGQRIQVEAQLSITAGAVSGKSHAPSRPGEPPNNDTGVLANNIETVAKSELLVEVSSNAPYAAAMEFGTSKIAERPYMRPARDKKAPEAVELMNKALAKIVRDSGNGNGS